MGKSKRKVAKNLGEFKTLYVRKLRSDNHEWIKKEADANGYCPSTLLNRVVDYIRKETTLEML